MSLQFHWFLPTNGDGRDIVGGHGVATGAAGAIRPQSVAYLGQIARSAEQLGFEGALTPTGACGEGVLPILAERGRWRHPAPATEAPQAISPFAPTSTHEPAAAS